MAAKPPEGRSPTAKLQSVFTSQVGAEPDRLDALVMAERGTPLARRLRRDMAKVEWKLWSRLANRQVAGARFRRQVPLGPFVVDFYCPAQRLVIEVDGPLHAEGRSGDASRDRWMSERGYQVLRFTADAAYRRTDAVVQAIQEELVRRIGR